MTQNQHQEAGALRRSQASVANVFWTAVQAEIFTAGAEGFQAERSEVAAWMNLTVSVCYSDCNLKISDIHTWDGELCHISTLFGLFFNHDSCHFIFICFLFCYYIYLLAFVFSLCHPHHAVVIQRKEVDCPALPKACTCTQDSKGPAGPAGPPVRHTHTHTHFGYWASLTSAALHFIVCLLEWNMDKDQTWSHICITQTSFFLHLTFYSHYFLHVSLI